jgi:chromosome partitioning protein
MPARVLAVANWKGGVGKTVVAVHLAHALAIRGARTLLVDADSQASATIALGFKPDPAFFKLAAGLTDPLDAVWESGRPNLWLVPADSQVLALPVLLNARHEPVDCLVPIFRKLAPHFAYIIVDTPPAPGGLQERLLFAAGEVVIVTSPDFLALVGVGKVAATLAFLRDRWGWEGRLLGIVPNMVDGLTRITRQTMGTLAGEYPGLLLPPVRRSTRLRECQARGRTVFETAGSSRVADDLRKVATAIQRFKEE